jgi:hypothetical protein
VPIKGAALLFASRGIEGALLLWATVGQALRLGLLLVQLPSGSFARDPKVYNVRHSFIRFPPEVCGALAHCPKSSSDYIETKKLLPGTLRKTMAKFQYTVG